MLRWIVAGFIFVSTSAAFACPNLDGYYAYPGAAYLSISEVKDAAGISTYQVTIDDGTCAACHTDQYLKADGILKKRSYADGRVQESALIACANNRLQLRQTTDYFDEDGGKVFTESINQDYRNNADKNLVIENMENEKPVSKTVLPRFTDF